MNKVIKDLCHQYKELVQMKGPDGEPGLNNIYTEEEMYDIIMSHYDEFNNMVVNGCLCEGKGYIDVSELKEDELWIGVYYVGNLLDKYRDCLFGNLTDDAESKNSTLNTDKENKKEFIKEVMKGIEKKKTLKDFLSDPHSYKQFRDDVDSCLLYMDWNKIHRVMKMLHWTWACWVNEEWNDQYNSVPSVFGIKEHVYKMIKQMEEEIMNSNTDHYLTGTGGFEYEMWVCDPEEDEPDDYDHRVRFIVRFVAEQHDNGI